MILPLKTAHPNQLMRVKLFKYTATATILCSHISVINMENSDLSADYWQYLEQICPNLERNALPHIVTNLQTTSWDEPQSGRDLNNVAVLSLIEADQCEDLSMKEIYIEMALEALKQGIDIYNHPLCAAHLALVMAMNGNLNQGVPLAFYTFDNVIHTIGINSPDIESGLIYIPREFTLNTLDEKWPIDIFNAERVDFQTLFFLDALFAQWQRNANARKEILFTYTKERVKILTKSINILIDYLSIFVKLGFNFNTYHLLASLHYLKFANKWPISCPELFQILYLHLSCQKNDKSWAEFWKTLAKKDNDYNPNSLKWQWTKLDGSSGVSYIPYEEDLLLAVEPTDRSIVTSILLAQGDWFEKEIEFWRDRIQPGMTVIDVGANVGVYTFSAARLVGSEGLVFAIEPFGGCVKCLEETCRINQISWVKICAGAASDRNGTARLSLRESSELNAIITDDSIENFNPGSYVEVPCFTLDSLIEQENLKRVDFMKIDAEGHELSVLKGSEKILSQFSPVILYENIAGTKGSNLPVADYLRSHGYELFRYQPYVKKLIPISDTADNLSNDLNIIALPAKK